MPGDKPVRWITVKGKRVPIGQPGAAKPPTPPEKEPQSQLDILRACTHEPKNSEVVMPKGQENLHVCNDCWNASVRWRKAREKETLGTRREEGRKWWTEHGIKPGDRVYRIVSSVFSPGGMRVEGTAKTGSNGAYVSSPVQRGQLSPEGWHPVDEVEKADRGETGHWITTKTGKRVKVSARKWTVKAGVPTPEDKRKQMLEGVDKFFDEVEKGDSNLLAAYLKQQARFHQYSPGNVGLILWQKPDATRVNSYKRWQALGRQVRKGERAISILAPTTYHKKTKTVDEATGEEKEEVQTVRWFVTVPVFDVGQTDGPPLEEFSAKLSGDVEGLVTAAEAFAANQGIKVDYQTVYGEVGGYSAGGQVVIGSSKERGMQFQTLLHEVAHELLKHHEQHGTKVRPLQEGEAEVAASLVLSHFGFDEALPHSAAYVRNWNVKRDDLKASLDRVASVSRTIIDGIEAQDPETGAQFDEPGATPDGDLGKCRGWTVAEGCRAFVPAM